MHSELNEVFRYLGVTPPVPEDLHRQVSDLFQHASTSVRPRYFYRVFPLYHKQDSIEISDTGIILHGTLARNMLSECDAVVLLACTLGATFDMMLRSEQARNMSNATILNACGNTLVEAGCDTAEQEIRNRFPTRYLTDRFSPGYGDLPLDIQPLFCSALDTPKHLGIHVTPSFLMNPSKSVTALIGLSDTPQAARIRGCAYCAMKNTCAIRKGGNRCGT